MGFFIDAGKLDKPVEVLELKQVSAGVWEWCRVRRAWASVEPGTGRNLFSSVGIGKRDWRLVLRRQGISLHNAVRWGTRHFFLTGITEPDRGHLELGAAPVTVETCQSDGVRFPGVLTEKYLSHAQEWPMSVNELRLVLVVPKVIVLRPGHLVDVRGAEWEILVPHELDEYKNEYEIGRTVEL